MWMPVLLPALAAVAAAAPPDRVLPAPEPGDVYEHFRAWAESRGRTGADAVPACRQLAERLLLCFAVEEGNVRRVATEADLLRWEASPADLERRARAVAAAAFGPAHVEELAVDGMEGRYWASREGDGLDAAGLLLPERLEAIAGAPPVVAVPARGVLLFWVPGAPEFDQVLAVGVRRIWEGADHPVSPLVYRWDGERWRTWGEARPVGAAPAVEEER